jgi:hypothetical protein
VAVYEVKRRKGGGDDLKAGAPPIALNIHYHRPGQPEHVDSQPIGDPGAATPEVTQNFGRTVAEIQAKLQAMGVDSVTQAVNGDGDGPQGP